MTDIWRVSTTRSVDNVIKIGSKKKGVSRMISRFLPPMTRLTVMPFIESGKERIMNSCGSVFFPSKTFDSMIVTQWIPKY